MKIYGNIETSTVDGPGRRAVIHLAGCSLGCDGCFSQHTHATIGPNVTDVQPEQLANHIATLEIDGVTVSGGEPTDQIEELAVFLQVLRLAGIDSIILYTGRRIEWLRKNTGGVWNLLETAQLVDIVVDGRYVKRLPENSWMRGSTNQQFIFLTERHILSDMQHHDTEVIVRGGEVLLMGFPSEEILSRFRDGNFDI